MTEYNQTKPEEPQMSGKNGRKSICPYCKKEYTERPALSRKDGKTFICPECGIREALESMGVDREEQAKIIDIMNRHKHGKGA